MKLFGCSISIILSSLSDAFTLPIKDWNSFRHNIIMPQYTTIRFTLPLRDYICFSFPTIKFPYLHWSWYIYDVVLHKKLRTTVFCSCPCALFDLYNIIPLFFGTYQFFYSIFCRLQLIYTNTITSAVYNSFQFIFYKC